jgi:AraC-like DNA-binding protein
MTFMSKEFLRKSKEDKPVVAICYDFDKTLSPDDMQVQGYIQSVGYEVESFWKESNGLAEEWVIKERVKDVEHYLMNTNLTLTEVAFTTGFASTSNLNDFCKAYLLDTPGEIRRKAQETRKCTVTRT